MVNLFVIRPDDGLQGRNNGQILLQKIYSCFRLSTLIILNFHCNSKTTGCSLPKLFSS